MCSRRPGLNIDCRWVADSSVRLDLKSESDIRHALDDIRAAEELAIRYGDRIGGWRLVDTFGIVTRHGGLKDRDAGRKAQQQCLATLLGTIAATHGLTVADIETVRPRLAARGIDLPVTLPIALLFVFALRQFIRWLRSRLEPDELFRWLLATVMGSIVMTAIVLAIGVAWAVLVEIVQIGNEHLSYRGRTTDLRNNFLVMFVAGVALTWASSAIAATRLRTAAARRRAGVG